MLKNLKYCFYSFARRILSRSMQEYIGSSKYFRIFRERFFRPKGFPEIFTGRVQFENLEFIFSAPYQEYYQAKKVGIEAGICRCIMSYLKKDYIAADVGASYGFLTLIMAFSVGSGGKVYSFEPNEFIFNVLKSNIEINKLNKQCVSYNKPLGFFGNNYRLDDILYEDKSYKIDLIKIDVDGGDYEVLLGSRNIIKIGRPVVIIEMTDNQKSIYQFLYDLGYRYFYNSHGNEVSFNNWPPNLIASPTPLTIPKRGEIKKCFM